MICDLRLAKTIICALLFFTTIAVRGELVFNYVKIADTSTALPGGTGNFANFVVPANDGTNIAFRATGSVGQFGVFENSNGVLTRLAGQDTPIPGGASGAFSDMEYPSARGTNVVFYAQATSGSFVTQQGIYRAGTNGSLLVIADRNTAIPSGSGNFGHFDVIVSASGGWVFFTGSDQFLSQSGAYVHNGVSLVKVANLSTPIPSGTGNFTGWSGPSLHGTNLALRGFGSGNQEGIYWGTTNSLARVADKSTAIPSGTGMFTSFGYPSLSGTNVAVQGFGTNGQVGIYLGNTTNNLTRIADTNTLIPGSGGRFTGFGSSGLGYPVSSDGKNVVFLGQGAAPGIFLYTGSDGTLHRVVTLNMALGGKQVSQLNFNSEALSGNSVAFWVAFSDGTAGIWKAVFSTLSGPVLSIERAPPDSVRLLWQTNDPAFGLQFNTNLATTNWSSATPLPVVLGTNNVVTNAASGAQKFYRLFKP
jgi:hypothetical protein